MINRARSNQFRIRLAVVGVTDKFLAQQPPKSKTDIVLNLFMLLPTGNR